MKDGISSGEKTALGRLASMYYKILKVNLTEDSHEIIKADKEELSPEKGYSERLSQWLKASAMLGQVHQDDREKYLLFSDLENLKNVFREGKEYTSCYYRRAVGDEFRWVSLELARAEEYQPDNQVLYLYVKDIHDEYAIDFGEKDFVTGGTNRRGFLRIAAGIMNKSEENQKFAMLMFNVREFKAVNEMFGARGGDLLLRQIHQALKTSALQPCALARISGDNFACLIRQDNLDEEEITKLCRMSFSMNSKSMDVYARCGIYLVEDKQVYLGTMLDYAKLAQNYIIDEYIKPYAVFERYMRIAYMDQSRVSSQLDDCIKRGEFFVKYQPVFDCRTGKLVSGEALVHWKRSDHEELMPQNFISALEDNGHITEIDNYVWNQVRSFIGKRKEKGRSYVPLSINLSWMDFHDPAMVRRILEQLRQFESDGDEEENKWYPVLFEVTEKVFDIKESRNNDILYDMHKAGAQIVLDDFGTGSSFGTLQVYDFNFIKLDVELVHKITLGGPVKSIIHSIIDMAHHMHAKIIAEGVETKEQFDFLYQHGCDFLQGYYLAKPMTEEEFAQALDSEIDIKELLPQKEGLNLTDLVDIPTLQKLQDSFAEMTGMAALTTDKDGRQITRGSNFTDFCMKLTRGTEKGRKRCEDCNRETAEIALQQRTCYACECHAGLINYSAPIMANGEMVGTFIGGQVLTNPPEPDKVRSVARQLGISEKDYLEAAGKIRVVEKEKVDSAAEFLYVIANIISDVAYKKYMLDVGNNLLRDRNMELDFLAHYDKLTKLHNRHHIYTFFGMFEESEEPYSVALGDIDNFKRVNDTYGHDCGDLVLSSVADVIRREVGKNGEPCRWGGEEFLILIRGDKEFAFALLENIRRQIENMVLENKGRKVSVTMTFGLTCDAEKTEQVNSMEKLVTLADERLYYGKNHGKNQIVSESFSQ